MKKLSIIDKLIAVVNSLVAIVLLISFLAYYVSPNTLPFLSLLSLITPFLIVLNILFIVYWILKLKRQFLISAIILLIGFQSIAKFYSFQEKKILLNKDLIIMSYNVRMFNVYNWINEENVPQKHDRQELPRGQPDPRQVWRRDARSADDRQPHESEHAFHVFHRQLHPGNERQ